MSKISITNHGQPLSHDSKAAMAQVGWVGQSGNIYGLDTPLSEIHAQETASYAPLYMQIGEWTQNDNGDWYVEQD